MGRLLIGVFLVLVSHGVLAAEGPAYTGHPSIRGLTKIVPKLNVRHAALAEEPLVVHVDAEGTTADGTDDPLADLEYRWDFGADGPKVTNPATGRPVDPLRDQTGPYAAAVLDKPGAYTITLRVRGRDEDGKLVEAQAGARVTVKPWSGFTREFGPGDAAPVFAWLRAGNHRRAVLGEGVYELRRPVEWHGGNVHRVVGVPGKTVLRAAGTFERMWDCAVGRDGDVLDRVWSGVTFDGQDRANFAAFVYDAGPGGGRRRLEHLAVLDCRFRGVRQQCVQPGERGSYVAYFNCAFDGGGRAGPSCYYVNVARGLAFVASSARDARAGNPLKDHALYPAVRGQSLVRWADLDVDMAFAINQNAPATRPPSNAQGVLLDGCRLRAMHGVDLGNANNRRADGVLDGVIIQGCLFDLLEGRSQPSMLVGAPAVARLTMRDNAVKRRTPSAVVDYGQGEKALRLKGYRNADERLNTVR